MALQSRVWGCGASVSELEFLRPEYRASRGLANIGNSNLFSDEPPSHRALGVRTESSNASFKRQLYADAFTPTAAS